MKQIIKNIICNSIVNLFKHQPDILDSTSQTGMTEWNLGHHFAGEISKYIFWLNNDVDVTKRNLNKKRPDIIFHKRKTNVLNFLVIELKINDFSNEYDKNKIKNEWMKNELKYRFGVYINFKDEKIWNGEIFNRNEDTLSFNSTQNFSELRYIMDNQNISKHDKILELVEAMLELNKKVHSEGISTQEKKILEKQIEITDRKIDRLVYELYDLTEDEIKIVEGA